MLALPQMNTVNSLLVDLHTASEEAKKGNEFIHIDNIPNMKSSQTTGQRVQGIIWFLLLLLLIFACPYPKTLNRQEIKTVILKHKCDIPT